MKSALVKPQNARMSDSENCSGLFAN